MTTAKWADFKLISGDGEDSSPTPEPDTREMMPAPTAPLDVVRKLLKDKDLLDGDGHLLLRKWRGDFVSYVGPHWQNVNSEALRKRLYERLENCIYLRKNRDGDLEAAPWSPDKSKIDKLIDALTVPTLIPTELDAPSWLSTGASAQGLVPCANGLVDVNTQTVHPSTPDYFGTSSVPFAYDPDAETPVEWMKFLRSLWAPVPVSSFPAGFEKDPAMLAEFRYQEANSWLDPADRDRALIDAPEIRTLQQWFGLILSGRTDLQKMLLLVGPPRCGKGTIARTLQALAGWVNCSAPTLAGIAMNFGLETSIGKTLMVVGDARLSQQGQETVVERLLSITGEDTLTLDRKNKTAWTGKMAARIMVLSNELPRFVDASGAIASRFVILKLGVSFLGREDTGLGRRIDAELPAILKWALDGLTAVNKTNRLYEPWSHLTAMQELVDLVSPISAFIRDVCDLEPSPFDSGPPMVPFADLYAQYQEWCRENGRGAKNTAGFSSDLKTQMPWVQTDHRPRVDGKRTPRQVVGLRIHSEWTATHPMAHGLTRRY